VAQMQKEIQRLKRVQNAEERKARTRRIIKRGADLESLLPDTIMLSDARFWTFLERTVANKFGRDVLSTLTAEQQKEDAKNANGASSTSGDTATPKTAEPIETGIVPTNADEAISAQTVGASTFAKTTEANRQGA